METSSSQNPTLLDEYSEPCPKVANHDFIKKIQPFHQDPGYFATITENQFISLYRINKNEERYNLKYIAQKKIGNYIYDIANIPYNCLNIEHQNNLDLIAVTSKNVPIQIYKIRTENENVVFKHATTLSYIKQNSEEYVDFLTTQHNVNTNMLLLGGKNTFIGFDLNKIKLGYRSKKILKKEIISCMAAPSNNPNSIVALGNFDRSIKIMATSSDDIAANLDAHVGGLTCLKFSPVDNNYLVSGGRRDNLVYLWDLRNPSSFVTYYERKGFTNQRLNFDISLDNHLYLGNEDGSVVVYDIKDSTVKSYYQAGKESINNISLQYLHNEKKAFALSSSGARIFSLETKMEIEDDDSDKEENNRGLFIKPQESTITSNNLKLWEAVYPETLPEPTPLALPQPQIQEVQTVQVVQENVTVTTTVEVQETADGGVEKTVVETVEVVETTVVQGNENPENTENAAATSSAIETEN